MSYNFSKSTNIIIFKSSTYRDKIHCNCNYRWLSCPLIIVGLTHSTHFFYYSGALEVVKSTVSLSTAIPTVMYLFYIWICSHYNKSIVIEEILIVNATLHHKHARTWVNRRLFQFNLNLVFES